MSKLKQILEGWKNLAIKDEEVEKIALPRLEICSQCEQNSSYPEELTLMSYCKGCGCNLNAKTRCVGCKCPEPFNKW